MIKDLVQTTLDNALYDEGIYTFDQRKTGHDSDMYIVYTKSGDIKTDFADDETLVKHNDITIRFYYRTELLDDYESKQKIRQIEETIKLALKNAGFSLPNGYFDGGDIEDIGYFVTIFEAEYWRVV